MPYPCLKCIQFSSTSVRSSFPRTAPWPRRRSAGAGARAAHCAHRGVWIPISSGISASSRSLPRWSARALLLVVVTGAICCAIPLGCSAWRWFIIRCSRPSELLDRRWLPLCSTCAGSICRWRTPPMRSRRRSRWPGLRAVRRAAGGCGLRHGALQCAGLSSTRIPCAALERHAARHPAASGAGLCRARFSHAGHPASGRGCRVGASRATWPAWR